MSCSFSLNPTTYEQWVAVHEAGHATFLAIQKIKVLRIWVDHDCAQGNGLEHGRTDHEPFVGLELFKRGAVAGAAGELLLGRARSEVLRETEIIELADKVTQAGAEQILDEVVLNFQRLKVSNKIVSIANQVLSAPLVSPAQAAAIDCEAIPSGVLRVHALVF